MIARTLSLVVFTLGAFATGIYAQPSGGPYGPVDQTYAIPTNAPHVFFVAPDANADGTGVDVSHPMTIESAIARATTGDCIVLRGGVYRTGNLHFNQGITFQPYLNEHPVFKGTKVARDWVTQPNGLWRTKWTTLFPAKPADWWQRERSGRKTPVYRFNNDMVFADGRLLHAVGWDGEVDENSYYIDYDAGQVYIGIDPAKHLIEITAFDNAFTREAKAVNGRSSDAKGPVIRGLTLTQYAYRAIEIEGREAEGVSDPATFGNDVVGTTLENVAITFCSRVAGYFRGDHLTIRNCLISDTRTEGIFVLSSGDVLLERNILRRNNIENFDGYFPAAVKIFDQCYRATCRDNLVIDQPNSNGIWFDVGNVDGRFVDNWVEGALDGFFFEISKGATVVGNVFVNCDKGVRALNSSNVKVYHNTFLDTRAAFERTERSAVADHFGWHPSTGPDVDKREGHVFVGNLVVADETYRKELLHVEQSKKLCGQVTRPQLAEIDGNVYLRRAAGPKQNLVLWAPIVGENCAAAFTTLDAFQSAVPGYERHSEYAADYFGAIFRSADLKNLEPVRAYPSEAAVPEDVRALAGWPANVPLGAGAYPLVK